MHFTAIFGGATVALYASSVNALPTADAFNETEIIERALGGWGYATFYDDHACTENGGIAVSIGNPDCLANEYNRNSIYIQPGTNLAVLDAALVWSPGNECDCQIDCDDSGVTLNSYTNYCWDLEGHAGAASFRFVTSQSCDANNC